MAGNTATISMQEFRADWCAHIPVADLCIRWTITKDQVVRLRDLWALPLRRDRKHIKKPLRQKDPTPAEIAERAAAIRATWDEATELDRRVVKPRLFQMRPVTLSSPPDTPEPSSLDDFIARAEDRD
jgi:hypothetical protein